MSGESDAVYAVPACQVIWTATSSKSPAATVSPCGQAQPRWTWRTVMTWPRAGSVIDARTATVAGGPAGSLYVSSDQLPGRVWRIVYTGR
jgi:glucose/arabinose dehydrogenase